MTDFRPLGSQGHRVHAMSSQIRHVIRQQCGADFANMFAIVETSDKRSDFDWYSPEQGAALSWVHASEDQRLKARPALQALYDKIPALQVDFSGQASGSGDAAVFAALLDKVLKIPDESFLFLVNGKPVLTFWGFTHLDAPQDEDVIGRLLNGPDLVEHEQPVPLVAEEPRGVQGDTVQKRFPWRWLWLFLLLLLLLFALSRCDWMPWHKEVGLACSEAETVKEATAPQNMLLLMDLSGSMNTPASLSDEDAADLMNAVYENGFLADLRLKFAYLIHGQSRLESARSAISDVVASLPENINIGLVTISGCGQVDAYDYFAADKRGELMSVIHNATAYSGTPLAQGLRQVRTMVPGDGSDTLIVVVSDGQDSCHGNPCAEAAALARTKPGVSINVLDIGNTGAGQCIAEATGGRVIVANKTDDLTQMFLQAANRGSPSQKCN